VILSVSEGRRSGGTGLRPEIEKEIAVGRRTDGPRDRDTRSDLVVTSAIGARRFAMLLDDPVLGLWAKAAGTGTVPRHSRPFRCWLGL